MKLPLKETIMTGVCVAILGTLGTWQVQRMHWKDAIIADLEASYTRGAHEKLTQATLDVVERDEHGFAYGTLQGHLLKDKAILLGPRVNEGRSGYNLLIPLETKDKVLIVDTGWVSDLWNDTLEDRLGAMPQDVTVRGLARKPDFSSMTSKNSPENNLWFSTNTGEIATAKEIENISAAVLYADHIDPPLQDVLPHEEKWLPRNKHLQYAIFWYAMGLVMLGVYGFYVFGLNKKTNQ